MKRRRERDIVVYIERIDELLWADIDRLIFENKLPSPDEREYNRLLDYIYRKLKRNWFRNKKPTPQDFERRLKYYYTRKRNELFTVLSYLITTYYQRKRLARGRYN
ncbi:MAG: hypothetical protein GSR79_00940 [Desulfurococcales archaeon]|nr:hypothetical protein [Desulfurococcales archaeon]